MTPEEQRIEALRVALAVVVGKPVTYNDAEAVAAKFRDEHR